MEGSDILANVVFQIGPVVITSTVVTTWLLMAVLGLFAWIATRHLVTEPGPLQTALEGVVASIEQAVAAVAPQQAQDFPGCHAQGQIPQHLHIAISGIDRAQFQHQPPR